MRTGQDQLTDLEGVILNGIENIRRRQLIKYAHPIVLEGAEGIIIHDLLELIATGDKDTSLKYAGSVFFEKSPVFCEKEFPFPRKEWDAGYATGTKIAEQKAKLDSGNIYQDGFIEGVAQGKEEKELEIYEMKLMAFIRKLWGN